MPVRPLRVLFLCTKNSARSQMAEAFLVQAGGAGFEVASAGAIPAMEVDPLTFEALDVLGVDWRAHRPKGYDAVQDTEWDVVITVCDQARALCPILPGRPVYAHWSLRDPVEAHGTPAERLPVFLSTARRIRECVQRFVDVADAARGGGRDTPPEAAGVTECFDDEPGPGPMRVLFLCTANSARSQIAEALMVRRAAERAVVASAGSHPAASVRPEAVEALGAIGIDWSDRRPKSVDAVLDQPWDLVITLCDRTRETCPALPNRPVFAHWGVPDPSDVTDPVQRQAAFRDTVSLIAWRIDLMFALRPEALDRLVLEQRMRQVGQQVPGDVSTT